MVSPTQDRRYGVSGNLGTKAPVRLATTANITLSAEQTIDGVAAVTNDRVLVKDQTNAVENGVYLVSTGSWTRDLDFNGTNDVVTGTGMLIVSGAQGGIFAYVTTTGDIVPGTTAMAFDVNADLSSLALDGGSSLVGYIDDGVSAVARTVQSKLRDTISAFDFMTTAQIADIQADTALVDVTTPLTAFFTAAIATGRGYMPAGTYRITSEIAFNLADTKIFGDPGATAIIGNFGGNLIQLTGASDSVIEGITFSNDLADGLDKSNGGLLYCHDAVLNNLIISNCIFTAAATGASGIGFLVRRNVGDTTGFAIDVTVKDCQFVNMGRIGCIMMNRGTAADKYEAARGFRFIRNKGINMGLTSISGFLLTLDGFGSNFSVDDSRCENCLNIGIENVGWIDGSITNNQFDDFSRVWRPLSFSNTNLMSGLYIAGNITHDPASDTIFIENVNDSIFAGNILSATGDNGVTIRDCNRNQFIGERYESDFNHACLVSSPASTSKKNSFQNCTFDTSGSAVNLGCLSFSGAATTENKSSDCFFWKGTGGSTLLQIGSATLNFVLKPVTEAGSGMDLLNTSYNLIADADFTLVFEQTAAEFIAITDTGALLTVGRNIILPTLQKSYVCTNSTAQILTFKTSAGTGIAIAAGTAATVFSDGTNIVRASADV